MTEARRGFLRPLAIYAKGTISNDLIERRISGFPRNRYVQSGDWDDEWSTIRPMLPNKARGVPRVDKRRVLNGILSASIQCTVARPTGQIRSIHHLLQMLCALTKGCGVSPDHGRSRLAHDAAVQMIDAL
jgi:hypothetical protein